MGNHREKIILFAGVTGRLCALNKSACCPGRSSGREVSIQPSLWRGTTRIGLASWASGCSGFASWGPGCPNPGSESRCRQS
eukprot:3859159-Rhodomonas_salina.1